MAIDLIYSYAIFILMVIENYLKQHSLTQAEFASKAGVSVGMVNQWIKGRRSVSPKKCLVIESVTQGELSRQKLRPTDWKMLWPELLSLREASNA